MVCVSGQWCRTWTPRRTGTLPERSINPIWLAGPHCLSALKRWQPLYSCKISSIIFSSYIHAQFTTESYNPVQYFYTISHEVNRGFSSISCLVLTACLLARRYERCACSFIQRRVLRKERVRQRSLLALLSLVTFAINIPPAYFSARTRSISARTISRSCSGSPFS